MRRILPLTAVALMLASAPSLAQTATDTTTTTGDTTTTDGDTTTTDGDTTTTENDGNFSRSIPQGLTANLSDDEIGDFQTRLDDAKTPQERNAIRQELQRLNQERHREMVQTQQKQPSKGFFESMKSDFNDIVSGKAMRDAKARENAGDGKQMTSNDKTNNGKDRGSNDRGSNDRGGKDRGGNDRGGRDNGGGGGRK